MRPKSLALLMLALGCGLVASIGITQAISKHDDTGGSGEVENVFVAIRDVPLGDPLSSEALRQEPWPKGKVPAGALTKIEDVEGRRTRTRLYAGEPILDNKLFRKGANAQGVDSLIPKGYRVVAVKVDAVSGGAGLVLPGSRVDVMVFLTQNPQSGILETATRTVLQNIGVFAVNEVVNLQANDKNDKDVNKAVTANTVSLLVTPEQAAKLTLAAALGQIKLIMRSPEDHQDPGRSDATPSELFGAKDSGKPEKETLLDKPGETKVAGQGFLELLGGGAAKASGDKTKPAEDTPPAVVTWTIRVLQPGAVNDVVLEADANEAATAGRAEGVCRWRAAEGTTTTPAEKPKPKPAPAAAEKPKSEGDAGSEQRPAPVQPEG